MENIIKLSVKEREELFRETAARDGRFNALIVEKNFWVCWVLKILFELPELYDFLIFKGGTSLSKVYNAIERFSEDIDLSISRDFLGFTGDNDPASILPSPNLDYVTQYVRIELGIRSDQWPKEKAEISPYVANIFPGFFSNSNCMVHCLSVNRAFWEKVTLLHSLAHRPEDKKLSVRCSRHYYDTYMLLKQSERLNIDTNNIELLTAVRNHKMLFYKSSWANYDSAVKGTLKLIPPDFRRPEIAEDYRLTTRDMIFGDIPSLDTIFERLETFQLNFNS